jgi:two-component system phosphate regulon sensor histidine kinase PhoR
MMVSKRLLWQLFLTYIFLSILSLFTVLWYASGIFEKSYLGEKIAALKSQAYLFQPQVCYYLKGDHYQSLDSLAKKMGEIAGIRITVILPSGEVIADSEEDVTQMDNHKDRLEIKDAFNGKVVHTFRYSLTLKEKLMYVAIPLYRNTAIIASLRMSVPITFLDDTLNKIYKKMTVAGFLVGIVIALVSICIAYWIRKPLKEIEQGIEKFTLGELQYRLHVPRTKEFETIANALNAMADQLDDKIKTLTIKKNEQQAVLESMVEGVIAVDQDEKIINLNKTAAKLFNVEAEDVLGRNIQEVIRHTKLQSLIKKILSSKKTLEDEMIISDKTEINIQIHGTILKNAQSEIIGALVVMNDVTRLRQLERVRRDFVANVSHEIRTPLTSIKGFAETLLDGAINNPVEAKNFIDIIAKQSNRLNAIIEDLLMLAGLEQEGDRLKTDFKEKNIRSVIESSLNVCLPLANKKNIEISVECKAGIKVKMNTVLIEQAMVNLIDNAIKYNPHGSKVNIIVKKNNSHELLIDVHDNGIGIDKKYLPRLFERFYRVDKSRSSSLGGTGLGLAIVKHIAQVHNGWVDVESTPGAGSSFKIFLPIN